MAFLKLNLHSCHHGYRLDLGFCFLTNFKLAGLSLEPFSLECQKHFIFILASSKESGLQQRNDHIYPTKILQCTKIAQGSNRKTSWILDVNISFLLQVARPRFRPRFGVLLKRLRCGGNSACWRNRAVVAAAWRYGGCINMEKYVQAGALGSRVL